MITPEANPMLNRLLARRTFLHQSALGLGSIALACLNDRAVQAARPYPALQGLPHFAHKAKRVIYLYMSGGPSHLETFDYKPKLAELDNKPMPESFTKGQPIAQLQGAVLKCLGPLTRFRKRGQSGQEVSDFLPHIGGIADDIAIIR